jgi:hypothetical protein
MSDKDDDSATWMDASIRLHIRQFSSSANEACDIDENDFIDEIITPPQAVPNKSNNVDPTSGEEYVNNVPPLIIAELVRETATASESRSRKDDNLKQGSSTQVMAPSSKPAQRSVESFRKETNEQNRKTRTKKSKTSSSFGNFIISRTSLPYSIDHNEMTLEWTAIINTNQEAIDNDDLETIEETIISITFNSSEEAREACHAYAPPRMHSFEDSLRCNICKKVFNKILRRPCHCKNCGVCVCSGCTVSWPRCMLPATYHSSRRRKNYKVCMACDWLNGAFRQALLTGDMDRAVALHATGNINTRCPFANVRGEHYYPVHCAVLGGNLRIFKWLVESLYCPINVTKRNPLKILQPNNMNIGLDGPVLSSQGKSVLELAMEAQELGILYYLIFERGVSVTHCRNLQVALRAFEAALRHLPERLKSAS